MKPAKTFLITLSFIALIIAGCSAAPTPAERQVVQSPDPSTFVSTPTETIASTASPSPTNTAFPTPTQTPLPTPTLTPTPRPPLSVENIDQWQVIQTIHAVSGVDVAFSPDGQFIILAENTGIGFYDANTLQINSTIPTEHPVVGLLVSQDGNSIIAIDDQKQILRFRLPGGDSLPVPDSLEEITDFCPQGQVLSSYSWWWARLFCLPEQTARYTSSPANRGLITMAYNSDASLAALGGQNGFELVSLDGARKSATLWDTLSWIDFYGNAAAFSPDGQTIALGFDNHRVYILSVASGEKLADFPVSGDLQGLSFSPDGSLLAAATTADALVYQVSDAAIRQIGPVSPGVINDLSFSPDGARLATANDLNQFMLWDVSTGSLVQRWDGIPFDSLRNIPTACILWGGKVAISPDGKTLAAGDNGTVRLLDPDTGEVLYILETGKVVSFVYSPDSTKLAVGVSALAASQKSLPDGLQIWDVASGKLIQSLPGNTGMSGANAYTCANELAFSADGALLFASGEGGFTLWDLSTGQQIQDWFDPKLKNLRHIALSPDGKLISAAGSETIKLWNFDGQELSSQAFGIITALSTQLGFDHSSQMLAGVVYQPDHTTIQFWNAENQQPVGTIEPLGTNTYYFYPWNRRLAFAFSPRGDLLAISADNSIYIYAVP